MTDLSLFCWTVGNPDRLLKNAHLRRCTHPSSLRRTRKYASFLRISGALHLGIFEQPAKDEFFSKVLDFKDENYSENAPTEKRYRNKMLYLSLD